MLVDANLLLYAVDRSSREHEAARTWLEDVLNGPRRVGLPWQSLGAFLRISTHPRAAKKPLRSTQAWAYVEEWLACEAVWTPVPTERHAEILGDLIRRYDVSGNLVTDAQFAALALEHGVGVYSNDTDFARFTELQWIDPLAA
jgi:toxin-antitoxin system PIN domain toxin